MNYRKDRKGEQISILGYGCMRFTSSVRGIDIDKAEKEVMEAYNAGVNYLIRLMFTAEAKPRWVRSLSAIISVIR